MLGCAGDSEGEGDDSAPGHMIRICSYGRDHADRRSPNYEVPIGSLFPGGQPLPYAAAQKLFKVRGHASGLVPFDIEQFDTFPLLPCLCAGP